jgi:hypothetical protein
MVNARAKTCLLVCGLILFALAACCSGSQDQSIFAAVTADDPSAIERALEHADINAKGPGGQTPLMNAVLSGKDEMLRVSCDPAQMGWDNYLLQTCA